MNTISVIIPTRNRADIIAETLNCLISQKTNNEFEYEIIVVDNNSSDNTKEVVESYARRFPGRLTYLFESKQARAHALNAGLKAVKGDIVSCVDDDCLLEEDYLWNINKAFRECGPDVGMVGGKISPKWMGGESPAWLNRLFTEPARFSDGTFNRKKIGFEGVLGILDLGSDAFVLNEVKKNNSYIQLFGANMAFRTKILNQYGDFSVENRIGEDTEMGERLLKTGVKSFYTPNIRLYHKIPAWKGTPEFFYQWWYQQGINMHMNGSGKPLAVIERTLEFLQKSVQEKDPLMKVHWRTRVHYHRGQLANIFKKSLKGAKAFPGRLANFIRLQSSVRTIDLEKSYESCFEPGDSLADISAAKTDRSLFSLLKNSVYVQFLNKLKDKDSVLDSEIKETQYYQESWDCVRRYGSYQGRIKDEDALVLHCRGFLDLYYALKKKIHVLYIFKLINRIKDHFHYGYPDVFMVLNSDISMVYDGAHRLACLHVLGERFVRAKIIGIIRGRIQISGKIYNA